MNEKKFNENLTILEKKYIHRSKNPFEWPHVIHEYDVILELIKRYKELKRINNFIKKEAGNV